MKYFVAILILLMSASASFAGTAVAKLNALSEKLIAGYVPGNEGRTGIAIAPLNCDEKLEKMRIGFAVAEILSRKFVASEKFSVVERESLDKVFKEQRLAASGGVSEETAVAAGKLAGARIMLLGNVLRIGGKYQVNARLVDAESGSVIDSAYAELDSASFESEAKPYLKLVPEEQVLSLYLLYNYRSNSNNLPDTTNTLSWGTVQSRPDSFTMGLAGGGIRYFPSKRVFADISVMGTGSKIKAGSELNTITPTDYWSETYSFGLLSYRALLGWEMVSSRKFRLNSAVGASIHSFSGSVDSSYAAPTVQLRGEYRPQSRFGVSLSFCYDLTAKAAVHQDDDLSDSFPSKRVELNQLSVEPSISFYF